MSQVYTPLKYKDESGEKIKTLGIKTFQTATDSKTI